MDERQYFCRRGAFCRHSEGIVAMSANSAIGSQKIAKRRSGHAGLISTSDAF